ncbi:MAG: surface antigen [Gammaproteobacteria bacterium]|jgi:surface antigen
MSLFIKRLVFSLILVSSTTIVNAECQRGGGGGGQVAGTLLGAALGGLVGSQIGRGSGNTVAIAGGVLAGGFIGNKIGKNLDCADQDYHYDTTQSALEYKKSGGSAGWSNPDSGHAGSIIPTRTYIAADGRPCREFTQTVYVDGYEETLNNTACRGHDGIWEITDS